MPSQIKTVKKPACNPTYLHKHYPKTCSLVDGNMPEEINPTVFIFYISTIHLSTKVQAKDKIDNKLIGILTGLFAEKEKFQYQ